eukprot:1902692-Alexandrium_andersonii.AAC.1
MGPASTPQARAGEGGTAETPMATAPCSEIGLATAWWRRVLLTRGLVTILSEGVLASGTDSRVDERAARRRRRPTRRR